MKLSNWSAPLFLATLLAVVSPADTQAQGIFGAIFGGTAPAREQSSKPGKRVEIDLTEQMMRAYEGNRLVMKTRISSGRTGNTPTGRFRAGPYKKAEHYSSLYHNAPMPWSVQVTGNFFIHGYTDVPRHPASKGCIRVPLTGRNPAKRFFKWCDVVLRSGFTGAKKSASLFEKGQKRSSGNHLR